MGGVVTEEQAISRARYLDLVYSQLGTLYDLIPHTPHPTADPSRPIMEPPADGVLGSFQTQSKKKFVKNQNQPTAPAIQLVLLPKTASPPIASTEVNAIQSTKSSGGKKKGKNKSNKYDNQHEGNKTQNPDVDSKKNRKAKFPFLIGGGDHLIYECPRQEEFIKFLKNSPTPVVLTDPLPTQ